MRMSTVVLLVVLAVIVLWVIGAYNNLVSLKNQVVNAWKQIDVQLKRRHDLIPNLVNTVKGALDFERSTLEAVISARNRAIGATGVRQTAQAEGELTQALGRLFALTEAYPDLKATGNVAALQEELTSTENKIGFARQLYNDVATDYNTKQMQFPTNLIAGLAKASPAELWEIEDAAERAVPVVDLSLNKPAS
jgi:LemA protein